MADCEKREWDLEEAKRLYVEEGKSLQKVADVFDVTATTVMNRFRRAGIGIKTRSQAQLNKPKKTSFRLSHLQEYKIWIGIKERCNNPNSPVYKYYGGRGIFLALQFAESFQAFYEHVGPRPSPAHSIERKDVNRGYEPGNIIWATSKEQQRNRRNNKLLTFQGITATLSEWSEKTGLDRTLIAFRLKGNWTIEEALTTPIYGKKHVCNERQLIEGAIRRAIKKGRLVKPNCCQHPDCNQTIIQAIAPNGYSSGKPLDVLWLCRKHRREREAESGWQESKSEQTQSSSCLADNA